MEHMFYVQWFINILFKTL